MRARWRGELAFVRDARRTSGLASTSWTRLGGLSAPRATAVLLGLAVGMASVQAASAKPAPRAVEHAYRGTVYVSYSVTVTDAAGPLSVRSATSIRYATPLTLTVGGSRIEARAMFLKQNPVGTYSVDISGSDSDGCAFAYKKTLRTPMVLTLLATTQLGSSRRMVTKTVPSRYALNVDAYPAGVRPSFVPSCDLTKPIAPAIDLSDVLETVISFDPAETEFAGTWPRVFRFGSAPFNSVGYLRLWPRPPALRNGTARFPAPLDRLAAGMPVVIRRGLASSRRLPGAPSITVTTSGIVNFLFMPVRDGG